MNNEVRFQGLVIWFDSRKGYGFVQRDDGQPDLFVHFSDVSIEGFKTLKKDQRVSFTIGTNKKGQPKATDVTALQ